MTGAGASPPFKIRSTIPGRRIGIKEWSDEELTMIIASFQERYPEQWRIYLEAETEGGFITNAMNDHIKAHIKQVVPELHPMHYRTGAVDFRFANKRIFHFRMWQPEERLTRWEKYWAYVREAQSRHQSTHSNGNAEWTIEQVDRFISFLQKDVPEFWSKFCDIYNEIGFPGVPVVMEFKKLTAAVFAVPEDINYNIHAAVAERADRLCSFEMMKPENRKEVLRLRDDWERAKKLMTFDQWRLSVKKNSP